MNPRRTVIGAAAMSLAVAGTLAGAQSAKADLGDCLRCDTSPRLVAISGVLDKLQGIVEDVMWKYDSAFGKLEAPLQKFESLLDKANPLP